MSWIELWANEDWNKNFEKKDIQQFKGIVTHVKNSGGMGISMRDNAYKLKTDNGIIDLYSGEKDELKDYVGNEVVIEGKLEVFELEGNMISEIWGSRIKLAK